MTAATESTPPPIIFAGRARHASVIRMRRALILPDGQAVAGGQLVAVSPEDLDQLRPEDYTLIS